MPTMKPDDNFLEGPSKTSIHEKRRKHTAWCYKCKQKIQIIVARIRTRLCSLPRSNACRVADKVWQEMQRNFRLMRMFHNMSSVSGLVDCHHDVIEFAPFSPIIPVGEDTRSVSRAELEASPMQLRLYLVPHFDYSFDLKSQVSYGKDFLSEHTTVIACVSLPYIMHNGSRLNTVHV